MVTPCVRDKTIGFIVIQGQPQLIIMCAVQGTNELSIGNHRLPMVFSKILVVWAHLALGTSMVLYVKKIQHAPALCIIETSLLTFIIMISILFHRLLKQLHVYYHFHLFL